MSLTEKISLSQILKASTYDSFRNQLHHFECSLCPLSANRQCLVIDRGNAKSRIIVMGEAPGREEDKQGKPFVGRSGKLLDQLLIETGLNPEEDLLVLNAVKCRPPENRTPTTSEVETCRPFLLKQIRLLSPQWGLLLGATAVRALFPEKSKIPISQLAGHFFESSEFPGIQWMVVFHPAYLLRSPSKKTEMRRFLEIFKAAWKNYEARAFAADSSDT